MDGPITDKGLREEAELFKNLAALYMGEFEDRPGRHLPEETEYLRLARIRPGDRDPEETVRLRELVKLIPEITDERKLRALIGDLYGAWRTRSDACPRCDGFSTKGSGRHRENCPLGVLLSINEKEK